jgi:signal peptidase I
MTAARPRFMRTKFFAGVFAAGILAVLLLLACFAILPGVAGWQRNLVVSGSMRPGTDVGDVVLSVPRTGEEYGKGTVIVFTDSVGQRTVHRVVGREPDSRYITKGDANRTIDSDRILPEDVIGRAALLVPWIGSPFVWFGEGDWLGVGLSVAGLLVLIGLAPYGLSVVHDPWAIEHDEPAADREVAVP